MPTNHDMTCDITCLRAAVEQTADCVVITDSRGVIEYVNPAFEAMTGYTRQEAVGARPSLLKSGVHKPEFYAVLWRQIAGGNPFRAEITNRRKDGSLYVEEKVITPVRNGAGDITHFLAIGRDVTDRRRMIAALRESEQRFRIVADHTHAWEHWIGPDGRFVWVSPSCERVTGYTVQEFMDDPELLVRIVVPEDRPLMAEHFHHIHQGGVFHPEAIEHRIRRKDGEIRWIEHVCQPVYDVHGTWLGRRASNSDITSRKQDEEFRRAIEQVMRHDLKSPLTAFFNVNQLLRVQGGLTGTHLELLQLADGYARKMLRLLDLSLLYIRMEQGSYRFEPQDVDLVRILAEVVAELKDLAALQQTWVETVVDREPGIPGTGFIRLGDPLLVYSLLQNLVKNAMEATPPGSPVTVSLRAGDGFTIEVRNQGAVPAHIRDCFFDRYVTTKRNGTGLGTYSAMLAAKAMGGTIRMDTSEEAGTTITIRLPGRTGTAAGQAA